jgi:hypothetical protein
MQRTRHPNRIRAAISGCLFVTFLLSLVAVSGQTGGTNYWTKTTSGDWEEQASWSLGALPDATQTVVFNNPGWKALAIGAQTAQNFPQSMSVQSLQVASAVDSYNTLLMNWSGLEQPLQTTFLSVGSNSSVVVRGSSLEVISTSTDGSTGNLLLLGGTFIHSDYSSVKVHGTLSVRSDRQFVTDSVSPGAYYLTNGTLSVNLRESIGGFAPGKFVQYGGANNVGSLEINTEGEFDLYGGQATVTNGITVGIGDFSSYATFYQYGGSVNADTVINGNYILNGGSITGRMSVPSGTDFQRDDGSVLQNGGTNFAVSLDLGHPNRFGGRAFYVLSNGVVHVDSSVTFRGGQFSQYNGQHAIVSNLVMQGTDVGLGFATADYFLGGGTLSAGSIAVNRESTLTVSDGVLNAGDLAMNLEATGAAALVTLHGGSTVVSNVIYIGLGNIVMSGGNFRSPGLTIFRGELDQSDGTNETGVINLPQNRISIGQGNYYLSGGTLLSSNLSLGAGAPGGFAGLNGVFGQSGGVHYNSAGMVIWGTVRQAEARPNGEYNLSAGLLVTPLIQFYYGALFRQTGGTNRPGILAIDHASTFVLSGGSLSSSNTSISSSEGRYYYYSNLRSFYTQTEGSHVANQFSSTEGGLAQLQGGSLTAPTISVGPEGELALAGAAVTNSGTFTILSAARVSANGNYPQLGKLIVQSAPPSPCCPSPSSNSLLDFGTNAATLRFRDSHDVTWDSPLIVANWSGSPNGDGTDRLYVGTSSQGLTPDQLALIHFANPAGLPGGNYPATILATGEVVPGPRPVLGLTRSSGGMVFSWSGDYQLLTSTNVLGPYAPISGATSPYTNSFNEPSRFFLLRSP